MELNHQPIWSLSTQDVYHFLETTESGLSDDKADQQLAKFGANELPEPPHRPLWLRFTDQLRHFMALLLWVAGILAFISGTPQLGWAIWAVIWINAIFSFWQEFQAEQALSALKNVLPMQVKVYRNGELKQIPARELVLGDVMQLEEGDRVSADARLVAAESLYLDISVLTGESLPVARNAHPVRIREVASLRGGKTIPSGEQTQQEKVNLVEIPNLVLAGSTVSSGRGVAVVYATGAQTEFGHVAHLTTVVTREPSTLEVQVSQLVRVITAIALTMGIVVFLLTSLLVGMEVKESFIFAIGIIVALVPEGLLPTVTLSLAVGVRRMVRRNALVRRLSAVETLSATTVICTDKTGTLTKNEMTVHYLWIPWQPTDDAQPETKQAIAPYLIEVTGAGYDPTQGKVKMPRNFTASWKVNLLLTGAALCSNARLIHLTAPSRWQEIGDPTEAALLVAAAKAGLNLEILQKQLPRLREVPFDSQRRMMTVVLDWRTSTVWGSDLPNLAFTKGAPLEVLRHCTSILRNGMIADITPDDRDQVLTSNDRLAAQGFRVLGVAARRGDSEMLDMRSQDLEQNLTFIGLVAMFDPPRPEVKDALVQCHSAGVKVTMVTGDYGLTAEAIARQIGLINNTVRVVTGEGMGHLSDAQLRQIVKYRSGLVFARMSPEHKLRLVQAYKDIGEVVAVTGDGVNDAPALRAAHIGIAMGMNGTDVAREAADIVLTDDNFATIVAAIEQGRAVYQNIRKFITYILASNVAELLPFLLMVGLKIPPALVIMQILAIDLGTDLVPALALGAEKPEAGTMQQAPRKKTRSLLDRSLILRAYCFLGLIEAVLGMIAFFLVWWSYGYGLKELQLLTPNILSHSANAATIAIYTQATTMTLATIVACQDGNVFACRSEHTSIRRLGLFSNPFIWLGIAIEWILVLLITNSPSLSNIFSTAPLAPWQWLLLLICPPILLGADELRKASLSINRRHKP
ncbi:cation-transporting P-type ATPase [Nostoc sp. FACHB-152]|uniref:cation-translocating P-type ATPase n=1 Tax=unclassified Nostoc TaxID=2593658 RepID=UPI00168725CF|nr:MULTISPECIES: cation-transporting P-type ATPase [unclassified Nostoc]MBD2445739.1 cation-transporting P-type ATPase [Nostoc sp. FACHB-152]MBD2466853.1 cation-transporting P-type ATPase [Nostoc sp. FACHB-145]